MRDQEWRVKQKNFICQMQVLLILLGCSEKNQKQGWGVSLGVRK